YVIPYLFVGPVHQRIDLEDTTVLLVYLEHPGPGPALGLLAPDGRYPRVEPGEIFLKRPYLPYLAAEYPVLLPAVKEIRPLLPHHVLDFLRVREKRLDLRAVPLTHLVHHVVGFLVQPPRVEREYPGVPAYIHDHVYKHH